MTYNKIKAQKIKFWDDIDTGIKIYTFEMKIVVLSKLVGDLVMYKILHFLIFICHIIILKII